MQSSPVAVGGVGGSGTRMIAAILQTLGYHLGSDLNRAHDNLWFTLLFKRPALWPLDMHQEELSQATSAFLNAMLDHHPWHETDISYFKELARLERPLHSAQWLNERVDSIIEAPAESPKPECWGWKEPNTHIFLPALIERIEGLKYIHVMRHGLDMAFSHNQNQFAFWGRQLLGEEIDPEDPVQSLSYWCAAHRRILSIGDGLADRFLLLNFDEFSRKTEAHLPKLLQFLGIEEDDSILTKVLGLKSVPKTIGRYRNHDLANFKSEDLDYVIELGYFI